MSKTDRGKRAIKILEDALRVDEIPDSIKRAVPVVDAIVNRRVKFEWSF